MAQGPVITEEMKRMIGIEHAPSYYEIEKEPIRRWADAIGDSNPLYHDEEYAKKLGYRSLIAPPSFLTNYDFPVKPGKFNMFPHITNRVLNGGNEYEFYKPVQAGDSIARTFRVASITEREGKLGKMIIVISEFLFRNQYDELVGIGRHIGLHY